MPVAIVKRMKLTLPVQCVLTISKCTPEHSSRYSCIRVTIYLIVICYIKIELICLMLFSNKIQGH